MQQWELAERRYRQIVPTAAVRWDQVPRRELAAWINQDVCAAIEQYIGRRRFRELAIWPIRTFDPDSGSPERQMVENLDLQLAMFAQLLNQFSNYKRINRRVRELNPATMVPARTEVHIGAGPPVERVLRRRRLDEVSQLQAQAAEFARRSRPVLVNVQDYFQPQPEWVIQGRHRLQRGDLIHSLTPELPAIGNMIVWSLHRRIDIRFTILNRLWLMCFTAARDFGRRFESRVTEIAECARAAHDLRDRVTNELQSGPQNLNREHCIILAQIYAAFRPQSDLSWLGLPEPVVEYGRHAVRRWLSAFRNNELTERIAAALPVLGRLYLDADSGQSEIEEAIASGGLVIVEDRAEAHWNMERITVDTSRNRVGWRLLVQLARKARTRSAVRWSDIYDNPRGHSALPMAVHRLQERLPPRLGGRIVPGTEKHTYRLNLESGSIHIFNRGRRVR